MLAYIAYRALETLARLLPVGLLWRLGAAVGWLIQLLVPEYRHLVRRNLDIAFGAELSRKALQGLARRHFLHLGGNLFCSLKMPWLTSRQAERYLETSGAEIVQEATGRGKGVIFALMHMGNWELLTQASLMAPGVEPGAIFQPLGNVRLNAHIRRLRERNGCRLFDRHDGFSGPSQWLRAGNNVGILVDQHAGDGGVWAPFFGRLASTTNLAPLLSRRTGAPVIPLTLETLAPGRWRLTVNPPLQLPADISAATVALNVALEKVIRTAPVDWFWVHNRWKTPNPDFLLTKAKRGIAMPEGMTADQLQPFEIIIRSPNWLGDACMAVPAVRAIRRGRPDARVTMLTPAKLAPLWRLIPEVDEVIPVPQKAGLFATARLIRATGRNYDAGILLPNSLRSALEFWRGGVRRIVGYQGHHRKWLLHQIIPPKKKAGPIEHHTRHYLRIAWRLDADVECPTLHAPLARAEPVPQLGEPVLLGLCPGAEYGGAKRWPLERFAAAAREVAEKENVHWSLFGTGAETALGQSLETELGPLCTNLIGRTSLEELFAALKKCRLLMTNDTGTMHLACLLGVPVVAIFGSTEPAATGPLGPQDTAVRRHVECSPCFLRECPIDFRCMKEIPSSRVSAAVLTTLQRLTGSTS